MAQDALPVFVFGCLACGKTVAGTEGKCPRCGASFEDVRFECPFCGELTSPSKSRCDSCGTEFSAFAEEVSETSQVDLDGAEGQGGPVPEARDGPSADEPVEYECPNCGKPVGEDDAKCPHCGASFTEE
jgi:DNA-directed RNA polymerase subunit RPC12/RpoP